MEIGSKEALGESLEDDGIFRNTEIIAFEILRFFSDLFA